MNSINLLIGLQLLRAEREQTQSEIESLEQEKRAIKSTLPKVVHLLNTSKDNVHIKVKDIRIYDQAINEIEENYSHVIFNIPHD